MKRSTGAALVLAVLTACAQAAEPTSTSAASSTTTTTAPPITTTSSGGRYGNPEDSTTTTAASSTTMAATTTTTASTTTTRAITTTTQATTTSTTSAPTTTTTSAPAPKTVTISVASYSFTPSSVNVTVGDTVTWVLAEDAHTSTSGTAPTPDGRWNQEITFSAPVSVTFTQAGQFPFFCRFHPSLMQGVVVVAP